MFIIHESVLKKSTNDPDNSSLNGSIQLVEGVRITIPNLYNNAFTTINFRNEMTSRGRIII